MSFASKFRTHLKKPIKCILRFFYFLICRRILIKLPNSFLMALDLDISKILFDRVEPDISRSEKPILGSELLDKLGGDDLLRLAYLKKRGDKPFVLNDVIKESKDKQYHHESA